MAKELKIKPLEHQDRVKLKFTEQEGGHKGLIVSHDTGTGKTFTSILAAHATGKPLIAVVPAALRENYRKELEASGFDGEAEVISYHEALKKSKDPEFVERTKDSVVVYDEAHRMGREDSQMSMLPKKLKGDKNLLLTGTLVRNHPRELVPLMQAVTTHDAFSSAAKFEKNFVDKKKVSPGLIGKIRGAKPGEKIQLKNLEELQSVLKEVVDHHAQEAEHMPSVSEEKIYVPMSQRQQAAYDSIIRRQPDLAYKLRHGIPPGKDFSKYRAFLTGLRQVSNTPKEFASKAETRDASKIVRAADEVANHAKIHPNYRGYSYSNFLKSGLGPLQKELEARGIRTAVFDGKLNDAQRKDLVKKYNNGEIQHLLLSSAGGEGLDLKGTKLIQLMEPHWNHAKMHQVRARGIRYKSHHHLPEEERHVHVQRFFSHKPQTPFAKFIGSKRERSADEAIHDIAEEKEHLNRQLLGAISTNKHTKIAAAYAAYLNGRS